MPQNKATYPAVVLEDDNSNITAYDNYTKQIKENVLYQRQRDELAKAKLDASLIPPEIDMKDIFPGDAAEINEAMQRYSEKAMEYADKGIDWKTDPAAGRERYKMEAEIQDLVLMSKQDQALAKNLIDKASQDGFDNDFLRAESYDAFGKFKQAGDKKGIKGRQEWLNANGSLLIEKPFDINGFMTDYTKDIDPEFMVSEKIESGAPGYKKATRNYWLSPEELNGRTQVMLQNPKFSGYVDKIYGSLSPTDQQLLKEEATANGYIDARQALAERELKKYVFPKQEIKDLKLPAAKGSSTKKADDLNETSWLLQKLGNARSGNTNGLSEVYIGGKQMYSLDIPQFTFDTYTEYVPAIVDPKTGQVMEPAVQKAVPERIEELVFDPESGKWYGYTNKTISKKISKGNAPKPYGYEMTDELWTKLFRGIIMNNSGTNKFSEKDAQKAIEELKAQTTEGGIDWDKIAARQTAVKTTLPTKSKVEGENSKEKQKVDESIYQ